MKNRAALAVTLLGMAGSLAVFVLLMSVDFTFVQLAWYLPALAVCALMVILGSRRLRKK